MVPSSSYRVLHLKYSFVYKAQNPFILVLETFIITKDRFYHCKWRTYEEKYPIAFIGHIPPKMQNL